MFGAGKRLVVTSSMLSRWCSGVKGSSSLGALRHLLQAYRAACHHGDAQPREDGEDGWTLASSKTFNQALIFVLNEADTAFRRLLGVEQKKTVDFADVCKASR